MMVSGPEETTLRFLSEIKKGHLKFVFKDQPPIMDFSRSRYKLIYHVSVCENNVMAGIK
jgi:hypothetical protein